MYFKDYSYSFTIHNINFAIKRIKNCINRMLKKWRQLTIAFSCYFLFIVTVRCFTQVAMFSPPCTCTCTTETSAKVTNVAKILL